MRIFPEVCLSMVSEGNKHLFEGLTWAEADGEFIYKTQISKGVSIIGVLVVPDLIYNIFLNCTTGCFIDEPEHNPFSWDPRAQRTG